MDFSWTKEQISFKQDVIEFARQELDYDLVKQDEERAFNRDAWNKCFQASG